MDSFASQGYTKFVSNPYESHTVGDPYTDYEKAARDMDVSNAKETFNPLVAAFPSVNVSLEKIILSKNEDLSNSVGSNSSNNWTYSNTEGASIEGGVNMFGPHFGVSANYQHSETVGSEWGHSTEDTSHINAAETAYLNANVRYNNVGTGSIYNVKPTTSFVLDGTTIGTITAKDNTTALTITPGENYPEKGKNGIAINTMDDFNSRPIPLNKQQVNDFLDNRPIMLETDQVDGEFKVKDVHGAIVPGGKWDGVMQNIKARTASIIVHDGENVSEKRVAAKDYSHPEDKTLSLTLKDALKLAYPEEITEKDKLLYYNDKPIYESSVMTYVDKNTAKEVKKQLDDTTGIFKDVEYLYDVKLTPNMKFTIKVATLYDGEEDYDASESLQHTGPLGTWYDTMVKDANNANTGRKYFSAFQTKPRLELSQGAKSKLKKNCMYYISMYMKCANAASPTIEVISEKGKIISSKKVTLGLKYQRVDILVENTAGDPIEKMYIKGLLRNVSWDDVSFTEVCASEEEQHPEPPIPGRVYQIVTALNEKSVVDLSSQKTGIVHLWANHGRENQKWRFVYDEKEEAYQIESMQNPNLILAWIQDVPDSKKVLAHKNEYKEEHYWILEDFKGAYRVGYHIIKNKKNPKLVLDVKGAGTSNETKIQVYPQHPSTEKPTTMWAQAFKLIEPGTIPTTSPGPTSIFKTDF
ncbi:binary toxin-like calcium binding domain-containing protein [Bacillus thuringiensis]|uniref:binary toxin-like calcium binding domain-containing protein n=1 Tax=Bacillus thuringiensis TaxID=1428 RepID=UPI0023E7A80E|nr:RICIN domain-containing protein [Bacillus thuringiensis]